MCTAMFLQILCYTNFIIVISMSTWRNIYAFNVLCYPNNVIGILNKCTGLQKCYEFVISSTTILPIQGVGLTILWSKIGLNIRLH